MEKSWKDMIKQRVCTKYKKLGNWASPVHPASFLFPSVVRVRMFLPFRYRAGLSHIRTLWPASGEEVRGRSERLPSFSCFLKLLQLKIFNFAKVSYFRIAYLEPYPLTWEVKSFHFSLFPILKNKIKALARYLSWSELCPIHQGCRFDHWSWLIQETTNGRGCCGSVNWVPGSILGQGTCLGCGPGPQLGWETNDVSLMHVDQYLSPSFSLPSSL